jgi:hypothetical protein
MNGTLEHDMWMQRILGAVRSLRMANQLNAEQVRGGQPASSRASSCAEGEILAHVVGDPRVG